METKEKYFNCINYKIATSIRKFECFFDILLTDRNTSKEYEMFDQSGIRQEIIKINILTDKFLIKDLECMVHSRFGNGYVFRIIPIGPFAIVKNLKK